MSVRHIERAIEDGTLKFIRSPVINNEVRIRERWVDEWLVWGALLGEEWREQLRWLNTRFPPAREVGRRRDEEEELELEGEEP